MISQQSLYIDEADHRLHLRFISPTIDSQKPPVLLVHGFIENGRIFYTESGKGLACELAKAGYPTYVLDLRGRGLSEPSVQVQQGHGQFESITETIPRAHQFIYQRHNTSVHWMAHSWGGVLLASTLNRFPELVQQVASQVYFGSKRSIHSWSFERLFKIELMWHLFAPLISCVKGYLPVTRFGWGADNETRLSLQEGRAWIKRRPWIDPRDGYDYAIRKQGALWPKTWLLSAVNDRALGNPYDVEVFAQEIGVDNVTLLSIENGNLVDYDHINMLTHPLANEDHFKDVIAFISD